ncbi:hypothetical protein AB0N17_38970 [Streptomyces sp. NPDC051133]|uniref:hypothetical protein n=1 Tax=Streptomyces sp. NPDC051133 TaxID=3155521 RepID=UPI003422C856
MSGADNDALNRVVGFGPSYSGPPRGFTNSDYEKYCDQAGYGTGWGQCAISTYVEEERAADINYHKQVSNPVTNCNTGTSDMIMRSDGYQYGATYKVGQKVSIAVTIAFKESPLGFGANEAALFSASVSQDVSWGDTAGETVSQTKQISPGYQGWFEFYTDHGTSHGIAHVVIVGAPNPNIYQSGSLIPYPRPSATLSFPMEFKGDLPAPLDAATAAADEPIHGLVPIEVAINC